MGQLKVVGGKIHRVGNTELEKRRVSHLAISRGEHPSIQMISGMLLVKRTERHGMPPLFEGPIVRAWRDTCTAYPEQTQDLTYLGTLVVRPRASTGARSTSDASPPYRRSLRWCD
jgi:hypothetical protein